jgi:hypothetical protein
MIAASDTSASCSAGTRRLSARNARARNTRSSFPSSLPRTARNPRAALRLPVPRLAAGVAAAPAAAASWTVVANPGPSFGSSIPHSARNESLPHELSPLLGSAVRFTKARTISGDSSDASTVIRAGGNRHCFGRCFVRRVVFSTRSCPSPFRCAGRQRANRLRSGVPVRVP